MTRAAEPSDLRASRRLRDGSAGRLAASLSACFALLAAACAPRADGGPTVIVPDAEAPPDAPAGENEAGPLPDASLGAPKWEWTLTTMGGCNVGLTGTAACGAEDVTVHSSAMFTRGGAYAGEPATLDADDSVRARFSFVVDERSTPDADGFVFVVRSAAAPSLAAVAGMLGYGASLPEAPEMYPAVSPSVGVEFDTWFNDGDPSPSNHVGLLTDGSVTNHLDWAPPAVDWTTARTYVWVDYSGPREALRVYMGPSSEKPDTPILEHPLKLTDVVGTSVAFGFVGATGMYVQRVRVSDWVVSVYD